ncbi:MAG: putative peptidoglycan glycosyltransferase FtsW [Candidatus Promineifilaceae bacterium]|nr:putative peptidoglycan glycosyltransferase FtsW [Candidatus Promineifilaceae bacterium]
MTTMKITKKGRGQVSPKLKFHFDYWLLLAIGGLIIIGLLTVYSTTFDIGMQWKGDSSYYIRRQLLALLLGIAGFVVVMAVDYHIFRRFSVPIMLIAIVGVGAILLFGESSLGAQRGLLGGSYQPAEAAKLAMILYIAHWLSSKGDRIKMATYGLVPFSVIVGFVCGLIVLEPDLSTAALIALVSITLFFIAGADLKQFFLAFIFGGGVFALLVTFYSHAAYRLELFRQGFFNPAEAGYQMEQTLAALGRGGWFGVGPGNSVQKFIPLPAAHTDGAFAIIGEEFGFIGSIALMGILALLVWRGFLAATRARDGYGALLAIGITCWLGYQALLNIAVMTAVIPFTGIPLPFISYGGSSFAVSIVGAGILLNISRDASLARRPQPQKSKSPL